MCQMCSLWIILDVQDQMMNMDIELVLFIWLLLWYEPRTAIMVVIIYIFQFYTFIHNQVIFP